MSKRPLEGGAEPAPAKRQKVTEGVVASAPHKITSTEVLFGELVDRPTVGPDLPLEFRPAIPLHSEVPPPLGYVSSRAPPPTLTLPPGAPGMADSSSVLSMGHAGTGIMLPSSLTGAGATGMVVPPPAQPTTSAPVKPVVRSAAGQTWEDPTLAQWREDDFRIFVGDLGNECTDEVLRQAFMKYPSFLKARVVRDKKTQETRGYGFVSFAEAEDFIRAMREMQGRYIGNRPVKLRRSKWKTRNADQIETK